MEYIIKNQVGQTVLETNDLHEAAQFCSIAQHTLKAYLKDGGGQCTRKNGYTVYHNHIDLGPESDDHRYSITNMQNDLMTSSNNLDELAEFLGVSPSYLYVRLSAGKGTFKRGRGQLELTLTDHGRGVKAKPGPKVKAYRYAATYPDEYPDTFTEPTHEVTLEEIARVVKTTPEAITQKFALHQKVFALIPEQNSYRTKPVVFKRLAPNPELDSLPSETRPVLTERLTTAQRAALNPRPQAGKAPPSASPKRSSQVASGRSKK